MSTFGAIRNALASRCFAALAVLGLSAGFAPPSQGAADAAAGSPASRARPTIQIEVGSHAGPVRRIAADAQRDLVVTVSDDKTARVWKLSTGETLRTLRVPVDAGEQGRLYGVALHPTRDAVAVGGTSVSLSPGTPHAEVFVFEPSTGRLLQRIDAGATEIKRLAWSADGSLLIAGTAGPSPSVQAFDATSGQRIASLPMQGPVFGLGMAPSGRVAATDFSGSLALFDAKAGQVGPVQRVDTAGRAPVSVSLSPDAKRAVVGYFSQQRPAVIELATGRREFELLPSERDVDSGALMTVAWSGDGTRLYAAGAMSLPDRRYPVWLFDAGTGRAMARVDAATDSILDLAPAGPQRVMFSGFDGSWGSVLGNTLGRRNSAAVADLRGADNLRVDAQGGVVAWAVRGKDGEDASLRMDMSRRVVERGATVGLLGPVTRRGLIGPSLQVTDENGRLPFVRMGGRQVALGDGELAISGTYVLQSNDALVGTSKRLMRLSPDGQVLWQAHPGAEVNAVVSARQGQLAITAMSDGSLRWWNAQNGALVLTLLPTRAGAWLAWTPQGYFDASAGADRLAGWVVQGEADGRTEFHSLGRFRDRFNRPDVVDLALQSLDPLAAAEQAAPGERVMQVAQVDPPVKAPTAVAVPMAPSASKPAKHPAPTPAGKAAAPPAKAQMPASAPPAPTANAADPSVKDRRVLLATAPGPVTGNRFITPPSLSLLGQAAEPDAGGRLTIRYALSQNETSSRPALTVRLNGRPVAARISLPAAYDGRAEGQVQIADMPASGGTVHLIAASASGTSEPLTVAIAPHEAAIRRSAIPTPIRPDPQPRLFLLSIGISNYQQPDYRLGLPAKDANDFADVMLQQGSKLYRSTEVRRLVNAEATREKVLDGLAWLASSAEAGDVAMLFIAGHGVNVHSGQYYFIPFDGHRDRLDETAVPERAIRDALARVRGQALFFVDTCHAGNVIGNPRSSSRELSRMASELASAENGVVVFASSSGRQESEEAASWGNGAFTRAVIAGLRGKADLNNSGRITFKGLDFYVSEEVRRLTSGRQTPVTITPVGVADFALVRLQ